MFEARTLALKGEECPEEQEVQPWAAEKKEVVLASCHQGSSKYSQI